jgi:hypothetical protein
MFWKDVFISWIKITSANSDVYYNILNDHKRFNLKAKVDNVPVYFKHFYNARHVFIRDLYDGEGK